MATITGYSRIRTVLAGAGIITALAFGGLAHAAAVKLSAYNADPAKTSVSGISSGGYFAQQIHIAYSGTFKTGAAIFAGGPYNCAKNSSSTAQADCMKGSPAPSATTSINDTNSFASAGTIDPTSNLSNTKVYMFSGTADDVVVKSVMDVLKTYYLNYVPSGNITYNNTTAAQHAWISPYGPNSCGTKGDPYISNCSIDPQQTFLTMFYGTLNAKNTGTLGGAFIEFDQKEFTPNQKPADISLADSGWLYVPANCAANKACKVHVAVHGCVQSYSKIGDKFVKKAGLNEWADTNDIIVVYPQTIAAFTGGGMSSANPNGCWDFWGYTNANAVKKAGPQMKFIKDIVDRMTSGFVANSSNPAPTALTVGTVTYNSVALSWTASTGASGYNVYRSGSAGGSRTKSNASLITGTTHTASGLDPNNLYYFVVKAQDSGGLETVDSNQVNATTPDAPLGSVAGPTLTVGTVAPTSVPLSWSAVSGATGYNIYQSPTTDGVRTKVNSSAITGTSYTVTGLTAQTTYYFRGRSLDGSSLAGSEGGVVSATTANPPFCQLWTSSNYAHTQAGRANSTCGTGHACAVGSGQDMGLNNTYTNTTLKEAPAGYYTISSDCVSQIAMPTGVTVGTVTTNSVALSWTAVSGASGYNVYMSTSGLATDEVKNNASLITGASYTVSGLQSNTKYYFRVTAQDSAGTQSQKSDVVSATTSTNAQAAPTALTVGTVGTSSVALSWTAASGATGYNIYQSDKSGSSGGVFTKSNGGTVTATNYTASGLAGSTLYYFVVKAYNASSQESAASNEVSATTSAQAAPNAPTGLTIAAGTTDTSIPVTFTASTSSDLAGTNMYQGTTSGGSYTKSNGAAIGGTSYTYTGLNSSTTYYFVARAVNISGVESANSSQASGATLSAKPAQPTNVAVAAGTTDTTVPLTWTASTGPNLSGYNVYTAQQSGGAYTKHNTSLVTGTSYTVNKLNPDTSYFFVVRAQNTSSVESVNSNEVAAKTLAATYCKVWFDNNYNHANVASPRHAYTTSPCAVGHVCAIGSNTDMGLNSLGVSSYLKEKPQGYFTYSATAITCP